ncbi:MAG: phosphoribosylaminoimidazolesuccinocarboxamide synthase [Candidatus Nealsonbacteria bacterium]
MGLLLQSEVRDFDQTMIRRGKVRDIYDLEDGRLMLVATDRISAFDWVLPSGIPDKGRLLTGITEFWFDKLAFTVSPNHLISTDFNKFPTAFRSLVFRGRTMLCKKADKVLPVECIVRGYITGSGWKDYQNTGSICGISLPEGLKECECLPRAIFTASTKADQGEHDENISFDRVCQLVGTTRAEFLKDWSLRLYEEAHNFAIQRGIIIADTKFEFGVCDNEVILIDEVLTPDSSRFWPVDMYEPGHSQPSFDKQFVRDYLQSLCNQKKWDKQSPPPALPQDIVDGTRARYVEAFERLTGKKFVV